MAVDITGPGTSGTHLLRKTNVNNDEGYIYYENLNLPISILSGSSYIYLEGGGSIGLPEQTLVYLFKEQSSRLVFKDEDDNIVPFVGEPIPGGFSLNPPRVFDGKLNIGLTTTTNQAFKYYTDSAPLDNLVSGNTYFLKNIPADFTGVQEIYDFTDGNHLFTSCGATGRLGPTALQIQNGYITNWHTQYLTEGDFQGYQDWTVPVSGKYFFSVAGASASDGNQSGQRGLGARVAGEVDLIGGETITIAVGQMGQPAVSVGSATYGASGGGTFVVRKSSGSPLFIAGGGSAKTSGTTAASTGENGLLFTSGGQGVTASFPGGTDGSGGLAYNGSSAGGGGFNSAGGNSVTGNRGGGSFANGLTQAVSSRTGADGGFGGGGESDTQTDIQSGGAGGYSGGAGSASTLNNRSGGGGGSFITSSAQNVATSNGTFEGINTFNGFPIENIAAYNAGNGSVSVTLITSFTSGNTVHPTAEDAENGTNAIAIEPNGSEFHAFVPINYDIDNNAIYSVTPHNLVENEEVSFVFGSPTPDIVNGKVYTVSVIDDFSYEILNNGLPVDFSVPPGIGESDIVSRIIVNLENDTIKIPNHGFQVDQPVQYAVASGAAISPLVNRATYYISEVIDANTIKLKSGLDSPTSIDLTALGSSPGHEFLFLTVNFDQDTIYIQNHGLSSGQKIVYDTNGGTAVEGLTDGQSYFVEAVDQSTIRLTTDQNNDNIVNLSGVGTGSHSLFIESINFETNTITLPDHGYLDGEIVEYSSKGQTPISGLVDGQTYYVIFVNGDNLSLASSPEDVLSKTEIELAADPPGVGTHSFTSLAQTPDGIYEIKDIPTPDTFTVEARGQIAELVKTFNPRSTLDTENNILFIPEHGFITGTILRYSVNDEGIAMDGLIDDTDYYCIVVNRDYVRLATTLENSQNGITISIVDFGTGTNHQFTTNQLNGRVVGAGNVSTLAGSILVNGNGTAFSKILKVGDQFTLYPLDITSSKVFGQANVDVALNQISISSHGYSDGDIVKFSNGGGVSPTPIVDTYYYYVGVIDTNTIQLYPTRAAAISGSGFLTFSSTGTGTQFSLTRKTPRSPIIRKITAIGSDIQITVDRPYSEAHTEVGYAYPTFIYVRPSGYSIHRPFDGGVEMSTGVGNSFGQIVRQTRKYFRYQSGKGIQTSFAINFKPSIDLESMKRFDDNSIECKTRRPHGLKDGLIIRINEAKDSFGALSNVYNGDFIVTVLDNLRFLINTPFIIEQDGPEARAFGFPQFHVTSWRNGALRSGMFDFQNGMFFEFDGEKLYAVRRSSTQQTAGTIAALQGSELILGTNTSFTSQLEVGDSIVLRGQTYKVIDIQDDFNLSVRPEYRGSTGNEIVFDPATAVNIENNSLSLVRHGLTQNLPVVYNSIDGEAIGGIINGNTYYTDVVDSNTIRLLPTPNATSNVDFSSVGTSNVHSLVPAKSGIIVTKTVDTKIPQEEWSIDKCDGTGPTGYNLDLSKIQMCYMDYSWYGAGKIRFGFKGKDGQVFYAHEFKHNNELYESYFRSGNLPARYEVVTFENPTYIPSLFHWGTSVIMDGRFDDDRGYIFTKRGQTLDISGTTTKSFSNAGIDLTTDLITSLTHGFNTGDQVQFQSIASDGLPGLNDQNPATQVVGSNTLEYLGNTTTYGIFVNSPDKIHLTPPNVTISTGGTVSRTGSTVTVITNTAHGLSTGNYVGIYGIASTELLDANGPFYVTVTNPTTFTYTKAGSAKTATVEEGLAVAEVINFTSTGNIQYTYFLHPDGSLNNTTGPNYQPLLSMRLSPSTDAGLTGKLGDKDIINRMQVRLNEIGVSTNELLEVKLILNGRLNNLGFTPNEAPSLVEIIEHSVQDTISGGIQVYNFEAEGGQSGDFSSTKLDISQLFELSNSILGGDNIYPDGPDILTVAVSRLTGNPTRAAAILSWGEAQA